jgi:hypothetical protein
MRVSFVAPFVFLVPVTIGSPTSVCKCVFGDSCWPSTSDFAQLAAQISQPLIYPVPPESACYPVSNPSRNCSEVQQNAFNGNWRSNQSGSSQNTNFESYYFPNGTISACYLNYSLGVPCEQGNVPVIGVDALSVGDVQAAVNFAANRNLRLVIKSTG